MSQSNQFQVFLSLINPVDFDPSNHLASFFYNVSRNGEFGCEIRLFSYSGVYYIHVNDVEHKCGFDFRVQLSSNDFFSFSVLRNSLYDAYLGYKFSIDIL